MIDLLQNAHPVENRTEERNRLEQADEDEISIHCLFIYF